MPLIGARGELGCGGAQQPALGERHQLDVGFRTLRRRRRRGITALGQSVEFALLLMMDRGGLGDLLKQLLLPHCFAGDLAG